jgi:1-deoxy-D-xylulose-5-phosphate reductoisomerase
MIHPQSIVHALVEFADGSVVSHLAEPDMRTPIQHALTWPRVAAGCARRLDWAALRKLEFEEPDRVRFPGLSLAYRAIAEGGTAGAVMNAANEAAVEAFLAGRIGFTRIAELVERAMDGAGAGPVRGLLDVMEADRRTRDFVAGRIGP